MSVSASPYLELLDWRRRVAELFAELRQRNPDAATLAWFRQHKDALFRDHSQSPIPESERHAFSGLAYWPFDPAARVAARFVGLPEPPPEQTVQSSDVAFKRIGQLEFPLDGQPLSLG